MKLKIVNETGYPRDTHVMTDDGKYITGCVTNLNLQITAGNINRAQIEIGAALIDCIAEPIFSLDNLKDIAKAHGYYLRKM